MKTKKIRRLIFSNSKNCDITLPLSWADVNRQDFIAICNVLARHSDDVTDSTLPLAFLAITGLRPVGAESNYSIFETPKGKSVFLSNSDLALAVDKISFINEPNSDLFKNPDIKNYMRELGCSDILKWKFAKFLAVDALFSSSLGSSKHAVESQKKFAVEAVKNDKGKVKGKAAYLKDYSPLRAAVFIWFIAFKDFISKRFVYLFSNGSDQSINLQSSVSAAEAVNNQIRALTKGDVTMEEKVLAIPTARALTELNELARETAEFKKFEKSHK